MNDVLLEIKELECVFHSGKNLSVKALDGVSFTVRQGELFSLVGESGSGKSTLAWCAAGLCRPTGGSARFLGHDLQMIFQDAAGSLNPRMRVGELICEPLAIMRRGCSRARVERAKELLALVGLAQTDIDRYPCELSGGQQQRIAIARAVATEPDLIIADEPIASLDVSMQARMANLFLRLRREKGTAFLLISHDLTMVRRISDRIGVLKTGKLVELADAQELYTHPQHPYTKELLAAIPVPDPAFARK